MLSDSVGCRNDADHFAMEGSGFFERQVYSRVGYLLEMVTCTVTLLVDALLAIVAGIFTVASFGSSFFVKKLEERKQALGQLTSFHYGILLDILNPQFTRGVDSRLLTARVRTPMLNRGANASNSTSLFAWHVTARLIYALTLIATVVTRVIDAAIGLLVAPFSLISFGRYKVLDSIAATGLGGIGALVYDVIFLSTKLLNPSAKF